LYHAKTRPTFEPVPENCLITINIRDAGIDDDDVTFKRSNDPDRNDWSIFIFPSGFNPGA
jgi:hypothetical protein